MGSIFSAPSRELGRWERFTNALRDQRMNEVGAERASAQQSLSALRRMQAQRMAAENGRSAMGYVDRAAAKAASNRAIADAIGNINADAERQTLTNEKTFRDIANDISKKRIEQADSKLDEWKKAGDNFSYLSSRIAGGLYDGYKRRRAKRAAVNEPNE